MINRNKRSVAINLKHPEGQALIRRLAADADVLLQNYRPGKMARLGLDYEALREIAQIDLCLHQRYGRGEPLCRAENL